MTSPESPLHPHIPWLPGEQFDIALDATDGLLNYPPQHGDALALTNRRIVRIAESAGERALSLLPRTRVDAVEIVDISRPPQRLGTGLLLLVVSALVGLITWSMFAVPFVSFLLGGIPALIGVYAIAGWAFPDGEGALRIYARGHAFTQPLRSPAARRDAYLIAQRLSDPATADANQQPPADPHTQPYPPPHDHHADAEQQPPADPSAQPSPPPHDHHADANQQPPADPGAQPSSPPHDHHPYAEQQPAAAKRQTSPRVPIRRRPLSPLRDRHKLPRPSTPTADFPAPER